MYSGLLIDVLPWWVAAPLTQIGILVLGMALDETYVNRATILAGALAVYVHTLYSGDVSTVDSGIMVGIYRDVGFVVGAYGIYAYIVDAYVGQWFRLLAFYVYSPLSVLLVIVTAGPTVFGFEVLFVPALALAAYGNYALESYLDGSPYYYGPESPEEFEEAVDAVHEDDDADDADTEEPTEEADEAGFLGPDPTAADDDSGERGILPEFMRRL